MKNKRYYLAGRVALLFGAMLVIPVISGAIENGVIEPANSYQLRFYTEYSDYLHYSSIETNNTVNGMSQVSMNVIESSDSDLILKVNYELNGLIKADLEKLELILYGAFTENTVITCMINQVEYLIHYNIDYLDKHDSNINLKDFSSSINNENNEISVLIENHEEITNKSFTFVTWVEKMMKEESIITMDDNIIVFDFQCKDGYDSAILHVQMPSGNDNLVIKQFPEYSTIVDEHVTSNYYQVLLEEGLYQIEFN